MKEYLFSIFFLFTFVALPAVALADSPATGPYYAPVTNTNTVPANNSCSGTDCQVKNPLGASSFCGLIKNLLQAAIAIGIPIAVLFIVYAGFKFVLAQGKPDALKEARKNLMWTLVGIAIFLGAWLLANVIANTVNALGGQQSIISCN